MFLYKLDESQFPITFLENERPQAKNVVFMIIASDYRLGVQILETNTYLRNLQ